MRGAAVLEAGIEGGRERLVGLDDGGGLAAGAEREGQDPGGGGGDLQIAGLEAGMERGDGPSADGLADLR